MEKQRYLEAGQIVNTHGIRGEVKIESWCDSPEVLAGIKTLYLDGAPRKIRSPRVHKNCVIAYLEGVNSVDEAMLLKGKVVHINRKDIKLPKGQVFMVDLIGLKVLDDETDKELGILTEVLSPSIQKIYVVKGEREIMIPAVDEFIREINVEGGYVRVKLIEGL